MISNFKLRAFIILCFVFCMPRILAAAKAEQGSISDKPRFNDELPPPSGGSAELNLNVTPSSGFTTNSKVPQEASGNHIVPVFTHLGLRPPLINHIVIPSTTAAGDHGLTSDFLCFNDKNSMVVHDVPCPAEDSQKVQVTTQLLEFFLKNIGSVILTPAVSPVPPDHLSDVDLINIGSSDWMNFNRSDFATKLQTWLKQLQENSFQLQNQLLKYLSSDNLRNITTLTNSLLDSMNASDKFNICTTFTNGNLLIDEFVCDELQAETETLNYFSVQLQKLLASENNSFDSIHINVTGNTESNGFNGNVTDVYIDALIQKLRRVKQDSKLLAQLYDNLMSAVYDFKDTVARIIEKFFSSFFGVDLSNVSEEIFSSVLDIHLEFDGFMKEGKLDPQIASMIISASNKSVNYRSNANDVTNKATDNDQSPMGLFSSTPQVSPAEEYSLKSTQYTNDHTNDQSGHKSESSLPTVVTNSTQEAVDYFEGIMKIALALISSLTELCNFLEEGTISELQLDEVIENMTAWHNLRRRTKREAAGYSIAPDACQRQGTVIDHTNFISLCSACVHTTVLDNTFYPRYLTEKICSSGSSTNPAFRDGCLFQPGLFGGKPGGVCKQQEFHILLLQKVPGKCMKVVSQGQEIITDQWQSTTHALRIGCECVVDQNSQFAKYANFP